MQNKNNDNYQSDFVNNTTPSITSDINYIKSLNSMLQKECGKGNDVTQLAEGDILVAEKRTVYTQYIWNKHEKKFLKKNSSVE